MYAGIRTLTALITAAVALAPAASPAQETTGLVMASRGDVTVVAEGEERPLRQGDFLHERDEIRVSDRSFAVLQFVDSAKVTLRPDSTLVIERYGYTGSDEDTATLRLQAGGMRVKAGMIASSQPLNFQIRTPLSLLSISGPEGSLTLCDEDICELEGLAYIQE